MNPDDLDGPPPSPAPQEHDPNRCDVPPVLDVHKVALQEISKVVGNEDHLDSDACAHLRGLLHAALSEAHTRSERHNR